MKKSKKPHSKKAARSLFAIFLMEDEDGLVTVRSDYVGMGENSYDLGIQILEELQSIEATDQTNTLRVEKLFMSSYPQ